MAGFLNRWNSDDAFINFRVVDQILAGNGPVFNAGERVEAATSTLWLALLTFGALLPGDIEWFAVLAGLAGTVAGVALAGMAPTAARQGRRTGGSGYRSGRSSSWPCRRRGTSRRRGSRRA